MLISQLQKSIGMIHKAFWDNVGTDESKEEFYNTGPTMSGIIKHFAVKNITPKVKLGNVTVMLRDASRPGQHKFCSVPENS